MHPAMQDPRVTDWAQPVGFAHSGNTESKHSSSEGREVTANASKVHMAHTHIIETRVPMPQMQKIPKYHFKNILERKYKHWKLQQLVLQQYYALFFSPLQRANAF